MPLRSPEARGTRMQDMLTQLPPEEAALLQRAIEACSLILTNTGRLSPVVVVVGEGGGALFRIAGWTATTKLAIMREVGKQAAAFNPCWVAVIADVYLKEGPMAQLPPWPLAEDTEAREALGVVIMDRQGRTAARVRPYRRLPSPAGVEIRWEDPMSMSPGSQIESSLLQAFWEGVHEA